MLKDMSYFYISRTIVQKPVNISSHYLIIKFANKFVENINLNKLLQDEAIKNKLPVDDTFRIPNISYSYTSPIRSKVTNYREVIFSGLHHEHMTCDCENSIFKDKDHSHVVTGNLEIADNNELRHLLSKGLNYRESEPPNKHKAMKVFIDGIDTYISKLSTLLKKPLSFFDSWRVTLLTNIRNKLSKVKRYNFNETPSKPHVKEHLGRVHDKYVLKQRIMWQLFVKSSIYKYSTMKLSKADNFSKSNSSEENVINMHKQFLEKMSINLEIKNEKLPYLYWLPKFHKEVVGFRFITSGNVM